MTEQSVRGRIEDIVFEYLEFREERTYQEVTDTAEAADRIIAIVREAMLAPSTIAAAHKGVPPPCQIERVLTNALNEVFGTE